MVCILGWWEYPSNVLEVIEMIFTAVVLVVRHKSISFSPEKKKKWEKKIQTGTAE